jgi:hypothetical protein
VLGVDGMVLFLDLGQEDMVCIGRERTEVGASGPQQQEADEGTWMMHLGGAGVARYQLISAKRSASSTSWYVYGKGVLAC